MRKSFLAVTALATLITAFAVPSFAASTGSVVPVQWQDGNRDRRPNWGDDRRRRAIMAPRQIARTLERRGYSVGDMDRKRDTYRIRASRPNGSRVILRVDAYNGRILDEQRVGRRR